MRLPRDILSKQYTKPCIFLCETDKTRICKLETTDTQGTFKFNSYSELSFETGRVYNDMLTGEILVNPYYDKIEAIRLIEVEGFGYFELQAPELTSDGIKESKLCTAYSSEYTLSTKYLENFYINTGAIDSLEVINATNENSIVPIQFYDPRNTKLSLLHLIFQDVYGWSIGHVDESLKTLTRQFEVDRQSIYDFLMNDVCNKFNCYIVFDTINNKINFYAESLTAKFIGDGSTTVFTISPPFDTLETVSIGGYKTTQWSYNAVNGQLALESAPAIGEYVEAIDSSLSQWETDVFISFDNLSQEMKINYSEEDIKTKLKVTYGDGSDIREVNLGQPYLMDLSYYHTVDWMGQDLYDAYTTYMQKSNQSLSEYTINSQKMVEYASLIDFEENRLATQSGYVADNTVSSSTVGVYYVRGGTSPNYYYTQVSLPAEFNANTTYYIISTAYLNEDKVSDLFSVLKRYNNSESWEDEFDKIADDFAFITSYPTSTFKSDLQAATTNAKREEHINQFFAEMWKQIGRTPLKQLYYETYKQVQITNIEADMSMKTHEQYGYYLTCVLLLNSIEAAISIRDNTIAGYQEQYDVVQKKNLDISEELDMNTFLTKYFNDKYSDASEAKTHKNNALMRLSSLIREDELNLDEIVETSQDSIADSFKIKQDAMESGKIELYKRSQPQLQFAMTMANIYALPEFEPIIGQFQLGNVIKVGLRKDYVKQSRLMQVNLNFDNFADFSCEFGELTNLRTQSDIHADLLSQAISAGKSVAQNSASWTKGSDKANKTELKLQQGLLDATTQIKSIDGTQSVSLDKYGLHLQKQDPVTGEIDPHQAWMVNNMLLFSDDGFKTSKTGLGQFTVNGEEFYGLLADAVIAGYIEGSKIVGGTIKIGEQDDGRYAFEVREDGSVVMGGGSSIDGYATSDEVKQLQNTATIVGDKAPTNANEGQIWLNTATTPYELMVYNNGQWVFLDQQTGGRVHTSTMPPTNYSVGDLWIIGVGGKYGDYVAGNILKADEDLNWIDAMPEHTQLLNDARQYFEFNDNTGLIIGQRDNKFKVNITATNMQFKEGNTTVVSIGNDSATIKDLKVQDGLNVESNAYFAQEVQFGNFFWKVETDGSLSLSVK